MKQIILAIVGAGLAISLAGCTGDDDASSSNGGSGGSGGSSGGSGAACSASPSPAAGNPVGSVVAETRRPEAFVPTVGAAAKLTDGGVGQRLELSLTDYANACDYHSVGLGKEGASELLLLLEPLDGEVKQGSYSWDDKTATGTISIGVVPMPSGSGCAGNATSAFDRGSLVIRELDASHVVVDFDLDSPFLTFKGTVDAPLCPGADDCGCAP